MKSLLAVLAWPLLAGTAFAAEPLTDAQLDRVAGGFSALSIDDAEGLVGESGIVYNSAASVSEVLPLSSAALGDKHSTIYKSVSAGQASTLTFTYTQNPSVAP